MQADKKLMRRHHATKPEPPVSWWLKQVQERPLATAGTVVSVVGGLLLLFFFWQLGRIPELDLAGISAILMAVAIIGFILAAALTGCAVGAGLIVRDPNGFLKGLDEGIALGLLAGPGMATVIALATYVSWHPQGEIPTWLYAIPFVLLLIAAVFFARLKQKDTGNRLDTNTRWTRTRRGIAFAFFGYLWLAAAGSAVLTLLAIFPRDGDSNRFLWGLVGWTAWCYFSNVAVARLTKVNILAVWGLCSLASLGVLLSIAGNWAGFPKAIIHALGLGEVPVAMVLTSEGCDQLNKASGGRAACRVQPGEKTAVVCPAMLRSRIGSPLFVELSPYADDGRWPQPRPPARLEAIAINKTEVPSWSQLAPMPSASAPLTAASGAIVTYLDTADKGTWMRGQCGASPATSPAPADSAAASAPAPKSPS